MIKGVLVFNQTGKPRLVNWYIPLSTKDQSEILADLHRKCNKTQGFFKFKNFSVIYKSFATLYFVFVTDQESELAILDLIQVFVECLDLCFTNVCELDLIFKPLQVQYILAEIISGGIVLETSKDEILRQIPPDIIK
jgi:AP-3 complex subunit sigma